MTTPKEGYEKDEHLLLISEYPNETNEREARVLEGSVEDKASGSDSGSGQNVISPPKNKIFITFMLEQPPLASRGHPR